MKGDEDPPDRRADGRMYSSDPTMIERHRELQRYVRFGPEDSARVVAAYAFTAPHLRRVSDVFYERIREHEEAHAVLRDEAQIERLRGSLVKWLADLFIGPHDDAHFARAARIGEVHVHVGLPARYMVSAMSVVRNELASVLLDAGRPRHAASVTLLLDVELSVMLDAYWTHHTARERELSRVARLSAVVPAARSTEDAAHVIEELGVIVVGLDADGKIALFNDEAERTTGHAADAILGREVTVLFPREDAETISSRLRASGLNDSPEPFDASLVTRIGRTRDVRARFKRVRGGTRALATFLTATDVTEEVALAQRTRQAERLAAIGRLAAGLAHEIRNPLHGAHLHLTLLERALKKDGAAESDDALDAVRTVSHEVQRLSALVTEFLQFARPQPLTLRPTALGEVCQHAVRVLAPDAEKSRIALTLDLPVTPIVVRADRDKLSQVLLNLVRNALEAIASEHEGDGDTGTVPIGRVVVRVRRQPRDAFLEVEDDGPGIARNDAPIFDAFYSTKPAGTGLGLPIAHRIVQDHGGALTFDSRPAGGRPGDDAAATIFRIKLPVLDGDDAGAPPTRDAVQPGDV